MSGFEALRVPPTVLDALTAMGYVDPTPVQREAIPVLLSGRDALVEAETGSGKTAAYGVPTVATGSRGSGVRVLVLVPTRELARQVMSELRELGTGSNFRCVALTGGVQQEQEDRQLYGDVRCVVATPGRLLAVLEERRIDIRNLQLVVLDEADRMLDMGFRPDVERLLEAAANRRQTALFSATLPPGVRELASIHLREPVEVRVGRTAIPETITHHRLNVLKGQKEEALVALLKKEAPQRAMVFTRTRERATLFVKLLKQAGLAADALQGNMTHDQRRHVFDLFSRGISSILVATDIASRGLDVPEMELVVNVDLPDEDETYLHRAGRAARHGRPGKVVTLVLPDEKERRIQLEEVSGATFEPYRLQFSEADLPERWDETRPLPGAAARKAAGRKAAARKSAAAARKSPGGRMGTSSGPGAGGAAKSGGGAKGPAAPRKSGGAKSTGGPRKSGGGLRKTPTGGRKGGGGSRKGGGGKSSSGRGGSRPGGGGSRGGSRGGSGGSRGGSRKSR